MFPSTPKSPAVGPTLDQFPRVGLGNTSGLRTEHLQEWRCAAQGVVRAYKEWCAAERRDSHQHYLSYIDALGWEERAARQLELDAEMPGVTKGDQS